MQRQGCETRRSTGPRWRTPIASARLRSAAARSASGLTARDSTDCRRTIPRAGRLRRARFGTGIGMARVARCLRRLSVGRHDAGERRLDAGRRVSGSRLTACRRLGVVVAFAAAGEDGQRAGQETKAEPFATADAAQRPRHERCNSCGEQVDLHDREPAYGVPDSIGARRGSLFGLLPFAFCLFAACDSAVNGVSSVPPSCQLATRTRHRNFEGARQGNPPTVAPV